MRNPLSGKRGVFKFSDFLNALGIVFNIWTLIYGGAATIVIVIVINMFVPPIPPIPPEPPDHPNGVHTLEDFEITPATPDLNAHLTLTRQSNDSIAINAIVENRKDYNLCVQRIQFVTLDAAVECPVDPANVVLPEIYRLVACNDDTAIYCDRYILTDDELQSCTFCAVVTLVECDRWDDRLMSVEDGLIHLRADVRSH